ncbi:MAG: virulence protein [Oscillospiraceae bacterium]|nr:virulence protein [Oscillospiraceae bacterium]
MAANDFSIDFNVTGTERKQLVQAIAAYIKADSKYLEAPTFSYRVDYFTIDHGVVSFNDRADSEEIEGLIETLARTPALSHKDEELPAEEANVAPAPVNGAQRGESLTIQMPAAGFTPEALKNLQALIASKGQLIRKTLGAGSLPIEVDGDTISFPWFSGELTGGEVKAYTHLIAALCDMAQNQKRISAKERDTDNEKYAFRCFLLRLGFIGAESKEERKILLRNLSGNSAFKSGQRQEAVEVSSEEA